MSEVSPTGTRKNSPMARASAKTTVPIQTPPEISRSSSGSWALALMLSARKPMASDSPRATTPRTIGSRSRRWRRRTEVSGNDSVPMSPSGLRTATAHTETPRIITPSRTAWPPTGASRSARRSPSTTGRLAPALLLLGRGGLATLEPLDASARVDQLLPARVERVAVRADLDVDLGLRGARRELVAARAAHVGFDVLGMDFSLHGSG